MVLLMAPAFTFQLVGQADFERRGVILLFTGGFAILVALLTKARRGELFAATVGYV